MKESHEHIPSGRETLLNLEAKGEYVFHGSENNLDTLEPRQAHTVVDGEKQDDDEPGVHASPFADIAILMALINSTNCKEGFESGFSYEDGKVILSVDQKGLDQLDESSVGYVYVFPKKDFKPRGMSQAISYKHVKPIEIITVKKEDLSKDVEVAE